MPLPTREQIHYDQWNAKGWDWREPTRGEHFRRCNYCGSIHPEDLVAEPLSPRIGWADQKYGWPHKFYVDVPNRNPDGLFVMCSSGGQKQEKLPELNGGYEWHFTDDLSDELHAIAKRDGTLLDDDVLQRHGWSNPWAIGFGHRKTHNTKFYSIHLADPTISDEVKEKVYKLSGLRFDFSNYPVVSWMRA